METQNKKQVEFIFVDTASSERTGKFKPRKLGQIIKYNKVVTLNKEFKKTFGRMGLMLVEDYEKGLWSEYGIKEPALVKNKELDSLKETNEALQAKVAELESQIAAKKVKQVKQENDGTI